MAWVRSASRRPHLAWPFWPRCWPAGYRLGFSIVTVFLFAGPHNWYGVPLFSSRMPRSLGAQGILPARNWRSGGTRRPLAGASVLGGYGDWSAEAWQVFSASGIRFCSPGWPRSFCSQGAKRKRLYLDFRRRACPGRDGVDLPFPVGHGARLSAPLVALGFLQRKPGGTDRPGCPPIYVVLATLPLFLGGLWWQLASRPDLPGEDAFWLRITNMREAAY